MVSYKIEYAAKIRKEHKQFFLLARKKIESSSNNIQDVARVDDISGDFFGLPLISGKNQIHIRWEVMKFNNSFNLLKRNCHYEILQKPKAANVLVKRCSINFLTSSDKCVVLIFTGCKDCFSDVVLS